MSAGMPELGSKISLISKADIRYEGRLFTVDPEECTIALANVRSFGTENRESNFPVAPQNQVYDYILFRASDIKDIRVVNNVGSLPNDPAIVQLSVPPSLAPSAYQNPGFSHAVLGHIGPGGLGQFPGPAAAAAAAAYASLNNLGGIPPGTSLAPGLGVPRGNAVTSAPKQQSQQQLSELSPTMQMPQKPTQVPVPTKDQDLIGGSRSSTATPVQGVTRKSPTIDQGVQVSSSRKDGGGGDGQQPQQKKGQNWQQQHQQHQQQHQQHQQHQHQQHQQHHQQSGWEGRQGNWGQQQYSAPQPQRTQQRSGGQGGGWKGGQSQGGGAGGNAAAGVAIRRGRGRGGGSGQGFPNRNQQQQSNKKNVLKFEGDYDFEQANEEFAELRSQLGKMKINATGAAPAPPPETPAPAVVPAPVTAAVSPKVNGEDKKDDSGNETGIGEGEPEDDSDVIFYDRAKSFFDNISCEAVERSKGHSQRTDWRQERKLNSETFGVASARRGGYRGRGYYGNRGMGNMYGRGSYRGYRGGGQNTRGRGGYGGWGSSQQAVSANAAATGNVSK